MKIFFWKLFYYETCQNDILLRCFVFATDWRKRRSRAPDAEELIFFLKSYLSLLWEDYSNGIFEEEPLYELVRRKYHFDYLSRFFSFVIIEFLNAFTHCVMVIVLTYYVAKFGFFLNYCYLFTSKFLLNTGFFTWLLSQTNKILV